MARNNIDFRIPPTPTLIYEQRRRRDDANSVIEFRNLRWKIKILGISCELFKISANLHVEARAKIHYQLRGPHN